MQLETMLIHIPSGHKAMTDILLLQDLMAALPLEHQVSLDRLERLPDADGAIYQFQFPDLFRDRKVVNYFGVKDAV